jgi:hypothetical protein
LGVLFLVGLRRSRDVVARSCTDRKARAGFVEPRDAFEAEAGPPVREQAVALFIEARDRLCREDRSVLGKVAESLGIEIDSTEIEDDQRRVGSGLSGIGKREDQRC